MTLEQCIQYITGGREYFISWETILKLLCELYVYRQNEQPTKEDERKD